MIDKDSLPLDKPRRTPDHPTKSHVVKTRVDGKEKIIRFGEQGASTAGKPKEGESDAMKQKRASFKARHAKNIAKGKSSPAYWADKVKWKTGGAVGLEELDEKYEGIKKPDFSLLESFQDLIRTLQSKAADAGTQEFDPVRALGRSGAAGSLEDLYEAYADEEAPHAARAEAGGNANPDRAKSARMVFDSFKAAGFSDAQARALAAEINREGSFNPKYLFGSHTDAANKATNVGMLSWQGDRADRLMSFMADRGLIDPAGRIVPGQDALNAQAEYLRWEMENDPSYARTRETFLSNPEIDPETAHDILGKNFIRWRIDDPKYRGSGFERIGEGYDLLNMAQGYAEGGLAELTQKYAPGGDVKKGDNPYDILNLEPDAFVGALDELGMQGEERKFLMDQYFAKSRALPMTDRPEGKTVRTILPIATPEGMSGYEALMSGDFEFTVPEILRGIYESPAEAINVASAIGRGVPVTEAQVQEAGMAVPELMAGVAPARAITIGGGRIGALDYDPTVMRVFAGPKAETANKDALTRAKRMKAEGLPKDDIWNKTGWFQLGDGQWRFEIDDRDVGLRRPGEGMKMAEGMRQEAKDINKFLAQRREDLKTQPDLFPETIRKDNAMLLREGERLRREAASNYGPEWDPATVGQRATYAITDSEIQRAYPSLMRETIVRTNQNLGGPYGQYKGDLGNLELAPEAYIRQAKNPLQQDPRGTLIHELQHAIQGYEGFSRGTNTVQAKELLKNLRDERIKTERDKFSEMFVSADPRLKEIVKNYEGARHMGLFEPLIDLELEAFQMPGGKELIEQSNRILAEVEQVVTPDDAFKAYERHLGELEARLAQGRRDWTPQQRRTTPPWAMPEYIPDEEQIRSFIAGPTRPKDIQGLESKYAEGGALTASQYDPDAIETRASKAGKNEFAAGGAVKYDPSAVDRIINQLREVNRG